MLAWNPSSQTRFLLAGISLRLPILLLVGALALLGEVRAESFLVNWGGDYLGQESSGLKLNLGPETMITDASQSTIGVGFAYDETTPKSPEAVRYNAQQPSAVFYGALQVINPFTPDNGDASSFLRSLSTVKAMGRKNAIGFGATPLKEGAPTTLTGLVFWQKKDFLIGANSEAKIPWSRILGLSVNSISLNVKQGSGSIRFAVRSGGKWYLSEDESKKSGAFSINESNWGEWKGVGPTFPLPEVPMDFPVSSADLNDIEAIGVFFQAESLAAGANAVFTFNSFQAECRPE